MNEKLFNDLIADTYTKGYRDAVREYAVWKDGKQLVGTMQTPLETALTDCREDPGFKIPIYTIETKGFGGGGSGDDPK